MQSLYFWKNWINDYRYTWYALAFTFLASIVFFWFVNVQGVDNVIHWDKIQEQKFWKRRFTFSSWDHLR